MRRLNSNFWIFWAGQTVSNLGSSVTLFAIPLLVFKLTGSGLNLGIATAASTFPYFLFSLVFGAWLDRADRKRLMILADLLRLVLIGTIPLLAALHLLVVSWLYAVGFLGTTLSIIFDTGEFAALPSLVDRETLVEANGRIRASYSAASVIGPLAAGLALAVIPLTAVFLIDSASFLLSAMTLLLIPISFNAPTEGKSVTTIRNDVLEGLRYVFGHPVLRTLSLFMVIANFFEVSGYSQIVLLAKRRWLATDTQVGLLYAVGSAGVILFALLAGRLRKRYSFSGVLLTVWALEGLILVALALIPTYALGILAWGSLNGVGSLFNINTHSLRQTFVPNEMLGRVMGVAGFLAFSIMPLGALLGGYLASRPNGITLVYLFAGVPQIVGALLALLTPLGHAERYIRPEPAAVG